MNSTLIKTSCGSVLSALIACGPQVDIAIYSERPIPKHAKFSKVGAGLAHACASTSKGGVWCWGRIPANFGYNPRFEEEGFLTQPPIWFPRPLHGVVWETEELAIGDEMACARTELDEVYCWGTWPTPCEADAPCDPHTAWPEPPHKVPGLKAIKKVVAGDKHACALDDRGSVWCWGNNERHQLGVEEPSSATPMRVDNLPPARDISAAGALTCAVNSDRALHCWGSFVPFNEREGSLRFVWSKTPRIVPLLNADRVAVGYLGICAPMQGQVDNEEGDHERKGDVACMQPNPNGNCAKDSAAHEWTTSFGGCAPSQLLSFLAPPESNLSVGGNQICANHGKDWVCSPPLRASAPAGTQLQGNHFLPPGLSAISLGGHFGCGITDSSDVVCWGKNDAGQLGNRLTTDVEVLDPGSVFRER